MKYCARCVTPVSRPNVTMDADGVCSPCRTHANARPAVDWAAREGEFRQLVVWAKERSQGYDCLIPVSGGKDSTWQVVQCLEAGLKPLTVSWKPPSRTAIGVQNLENLIALGVDHIDFQVSPPVERKFLYQALKRYGATAIPMHMAMFNIPLKIATRFRIPVVVWGENSALEYGTPGPHGGRVMDDQWLRTYGVTHGTTARDWISSELSEQELTPYFGPSPGELKDSPVQMVFLGYYFPWDPQNSLQVALGHGFRARPEGPKTGYYDYADIDDDFISIHHYLKWYKFGFTRTYDNLSLEIRHGRMTRDEAIDVLRARGDETPHDDIARFCDFLRISRSQFFEHVEHFRNEQVWVRCNSTWTINDFLIPDWKWA